MADEPKEAEAKPAAVSVLPMKMVVLIAAGALLLGLGVAVAVFFAMRGHDKPAEATAEAEPAHKEADKEKPKPAGEEGHKGETAAKGEPGAIVDLDPFIVNLADAGEPRYLKLTVKLELDRPAAGEELKNILPQTRDTVLTLLSSKDSGFVRSQPGKSQLREEIVHRLNGLLPKGGIRAAYFTEFIVQ